MGSLDGVRSEYQEIKETEATSQSTLLSMLAQGKPYAFIVASVEGDENERLLLQLATNIGSADNGILHTILEGTLKSLPAPIESEK